MPRLPPTEMKRDVSTDRAYVYWQNRKTYFGKWGSKDAALLFAKWLDQAYATTANISPASSITVVECAELYLEHAEKYYSLDGVPSQEFRNVRAAMASLIELAGSVRAVDFGPRKLAEIQSALSAMRKSGPKSKQLYSRNTINARINRIRRCFRWCASQEHVPDTVVNALWIVPGLSKGRTQARETTPVTPVAISTVQATIPFLSPTVAAMVRVQLLCGMRPQDVCRITTGAIDKSRDIWLYRPLAHKMAHIGQGLVKAIPPQAQAILEPLLRQSADEPLFSPLDSLEHWWQLSRTSGKPTRTTRQRTPYTTASYGKSIVYAIQRAAKSGVVIANWTPNQLRHSIATQLRESLGIEAAQLFLGHAKPDATFIYAESSVTKLMEIARGLTSPLDCSPREPRQR